MNLNDVIVQEREALLAEYALAGVSPYSAITHADVLVRTPSMLRAKHPVRIEKLERAKPDQAFVQICDSLHYKFLWVGTDNDAYREDYLRFLHAYHSPNLTIPPAHLHVDHLFNRERARAMGLPLIRLILLEGSVNTSHGAGYESQRTSGGIGRVGRDRGIDEVMLLKLMGIRTPRKGMPITPDIARQLDRLAALYGVPRQEIERNIRELMDVAAFRPV